VRRVFLPRRLLVDSTAQLKTFVLCYSGRISLALSRAFAIRMAFPQISDQRVASSMRVGVPAATAEDLACCGSGEFAMIVFDLAIDDGVVDA